MDRAPAREGNGMGNFLREEATTKEHRYQVSPQEGAHNLPGARVREMKSSRVQRTPLHVSSSFEKGHKRGVTSDSRRPQLLLRGEELSQVSGPVVTHPFAKVAQHPGTLSLTLW